MNAVPFRRAAIFTAVAGLGGALAALLSGNGGGGSRASRPSLPVVEVPSGTEVRGGGVTGVTIVSAEGVVISDVREIELDDGSRVPFRAMVLRAASERPLPSPAPGVRSLALEDPDLLLSPEPKTREKLAAAAADAPIHLRAPRGRLQLGPGEEMRLRLEGGVRVELLRDGVPWTLEAEVVDADLRTRRISAPGAVRVASADIEAAGRDLETEEGGGRLLLSGGAAGRVLRAAGARVGGEGSGEPLDFACRGPFLLERLAAPPAYADPAAAAASGWYRITLADDASLAQGEGRLSAPRIEVDLRRGAEAAGGGGSDLPVTELRALGGAVLSGGTGDRAYEARSRDLAARPGRAGTTEVLLDGEPALVLRERRDGVLRTLRASSAGPASVAFPRAEGPVTALFRGSAAASLLEEGPGTAPPRRDLRARMIRVDAYRREGGGPAELREVTAEGDAELVEGDRSARARLIAWTPAGDGGSRIALRETVAVHWPAAGLLDPVSAAAGGGKEAAAGGALLLSTPREAILLLPPPGAADRGAGVSVSGGTVLRRIVGEQEVYRLTCGRIEALLHPGNRGIARIEALKDVRLEGREENAAGRRYDLRGARLLVTGEEGEEEPREALLEGAAPGPRASASFTGEDGRPFTVTADVITMDRRTGGFRASGDVRGEGVLPEKAGPAGIRGGRAEIACPALSGTLEPGEARGVSRLRGLRAEGPVFVKTETEFASGDLLRWDADGGRLLLEGSPARVTARSEIASLRLVDSCEAPEFLLTLSGGVLVEARASKGGTFVFHRLPASSAGKEAPAERYEARCSGPLLYTPGETRMGEDVSLVRSTRDAAGGFEEKERLRGADALRILHPAAPGSTTGRFTSAEALSRTGSIGIEADDGGMGASGVSRILVDAATSTLVLDASPEHPRFRLVTGGREGRMRRAVYDYAQGIVTEQVGATIGD